MEAIALAFNEAFSPYSLVMLTCGVLMGLLLGVIPGLGGLLGMIVLIPLTYQLDPYAAIALLLGLASVTTTSDTIPAVLIGVPGTAGAITTVEDGHPLAKQGQAARALGAAYFSSMIGGVFGAIVLAMSIPIMRPLMTSLKTPDFLAISVIGLLFVSLVSGRDGLKGLAAMLFGIVLSLVGLDPQTGAERYTAGSLFLWDGLPLAATFLGVFGLAELTALVRRRTIAEPSTKGVEATSVATGFKDVVREWRLVLQCSSIGALIGAIPGVGVIVIDWIAYGLASRNRRGGPPFGEGNIRGVIAPESANNAKEGGYLIPTIAFGIPGSAGMVFLLAALTIQGIEPGPAMLTTDLPITYSMVFYIAVANVIGASLCIVFTKQLAKIASIPTYYIVPVALTFITLAALQGNTAHETVIIFLGFGIVGLLMKARRWSRAALALGFVLGPNVERYFSLSYQISGFDWLTRPLVLVAGLAAVALAIRSIAKWRRERSASIKLEGGTVLDPITYLALLGVGAIGFFGVSGLPIASRLFPQLVAASLAVVALLLLARDKPSFETLRNALSNPTPSRQFAPAMFVIASCAGIGLLIYTFGYIVAAATYIIVGVFMMRRAFGWGPVVLSGLLTTLLWIVFDVATSATWPRSLIGISL